MRHDFEHLQYVIVKGVNLMPRLCYLLLLEFPVGYVSAGDSSAQIFAFLIKHRFTGMPYPPLTATFCYYAEFDFRHIIMTVINCIEMITVNLYILRMDNPSQKTWIFYEFFRQISADTCT